MMRAAIVVTVLLIFLLGMRLLMRGSGGMVDNGKAVTASVQINHGMDENGSRLVTFSLPAAKSLSLRKAPTFEVRTEAGKVTWPTRKETGITTAMVFVMVFFAAMFFFMRFRLLRGNCTTI